MKLEEPTTIDSKIAVVVYTFKLEPPMLIIALVPKLTSLKAASARPGRSKAATEPENKSFLIFMSIRYELVKAIY